MNRQIGVVPFIFNSKYFGNSCLSHRCLIYNYLVIKYFPNYCTKVNHGAKSFFNTSSDKSSATDEVTSNVSDDKDQMEPKKMKWNSQSLEELFVPAAGSENKLIGKKIPTKLFKHGIRETINQVRREVENIDCMSEERRGILHGKMASYKQLFIINNFIEEREEATEIDWNALKDEIIAIDGFVHAGNVDGKILDALLQVKKLKLARCFIKYLRDKTGKEPHLAVIGIYCQICFREASDCTEEDYDIIINAANAAMKKYPLLDSNTGSSLIVGLSITREYKKCYEIKKKCVEDPSSYAYSAFVNALLNNKEFDLAWDLLHEMGRKILFVENFVYSTFVKVHRGNVGEFEKLFKWFSQYEVIPSQSVLRSIEKAIFTATDGNLQGSLTTVSFTGQCALCHANFLPVSVDKNEFKLLRDTFLKLAVVGPDVFQKSNPKEFAKYFRYIQTTAPYDVVIDGLNVAMMVPRGKKHDCARFLLATTQYFINQKKRVLVLGRKHMLSYSRHVLDYIQEYANLFLIDDISKDDEFMLYATMYSGPDSYFVSRDFMRTHKALLGNTQLERLFKRWQQSRQIVIKYITDDNKVLLKDVLDFQMFAQPRVDGGWHIPYVDDDETVDDSYTIRRKWMCIRPTNMNLQPTNHRTKNISVK